MWFNDTLSSQLSFYVVKVRLQFASSMNFHFIFYPERRKVCGSVFAWKYTFNCFCELNKFFLIVSEMKISQIKRKNRIYANLKHQKYLNILLCNYLLERTSSRLVVRIQNAVKFHVFFFSTNLWTKIFFLSRLKTRFFQMLGILFLHRHHCQWGVVKPIWKY